MAQPVAAFAAGEKRDFIVVVMSDNTVCVWGPTEEGDGEPEWSKLPDIPREPATLKGGRFKVV